MSTTVTNSSPSYSLNPIFGPDWTSQNEPFKASDDRVRGGTSLVPSCPVRTGVANFQSYLDILSDENGEYAWFHGTLDTKTLGGAGFASQKTATTSKTWNLSATDGIFLDLLDTDGTVPPIPQGLSSFIFLTVL